MTKFKSLQRLGVFDVMIVERDVDGESDGDGLQGFVHRFRSMGP